MAQLNPMPRSAFGLYHNARQKKLVGEASEMGLRPGHHWDRLYDDACDVGIVLRSHRTGELSRWFLSETIKDADGDVTEWVLKPCSETLHKLPYLAMYTLHILND